MAKNSQSKRRPRKRQYAKASRSETLIDPAKRIKQPFAELLPEQLTREALDERDRVLAILDSWRDALGDFYFPLWGRVRNGADPRDPNYMRGRAMP